MLCLPLAGVLFFLPTDPGVDEQRSPEDSQKEYHRLEQRLQALQESADSGEAAGRVLTLLKEARFQQLRKHSARAFTLYHRVREEVESDLGGPLDPKPLPEEVGKTLREVRDFVNQELITLGPEARKNKS